MPKKAGGGETKLSCQDAYTAIIMPVSALVDLEFFHNKKFKEMS
jgi:hypothetical protein